MNGIGIIKRRECGKTRMLALRDGRGSQIGGHFAAGRVIGLYFAWEYAFLYLLGSVFSWGVLICNWAMVM